jgi:CheY-like chemotaxis protein
MCCRRIDHWVWPAVRMPPTCWAIETNGHPVMTEHDPGSALERAGHEAFDAFLLDIGLPGMDGNELVRRLLAMPPARTAVMGHNRR